MASDAPDRNEEALLPQPGRELRVDPPHPAQSPSRSEARPRVAAVSANIHAAAVAEHAFEADDASDRDLFLGVAETAAPLDSSPLILAQHAANLADRLQQRLADADRRESRLNSQEAEFDSRVRNARLWIDQRDAELAELQQRLETWEQELSERQASAAVQLSEADELAQRLKELAIREKAAEAIQLELELGRTEQQTKLDALDFETAGCRTRQLELDQAKQRVEQRQRDLDQREATLYTEQERISRERIALDGRETKLASRESSCVIREASLKQGESRLADEAGEIEFQRAELQQASAALATRLESVAADERRLEFRQREIATAIERFERLGIVEQTMDELRREAEEVAMRSAYVDNAESLLAERQTQLADQRRELEREQLAFENQVTRERRALVAEAEQTKSQVDQRQRDLERREAGLDQRQQALEEIAEQLRATQRESLEMRLATEETWLQLQGVLAPAALSRSIAQVRGRLADHFHVAADEVRVRRQELEKVRQELADQYDAVQQQRQELQRWAELREQDVEQRAAHLVAREHELDTQQKQYEASQRTWEVERAEYQQELQRLLGQMRAGYKAAA